MQSCSFGSDSHGCLRSRYDVVVMIKEYFSIFVVAQDLQVANSKGVD